LAEYLAKEVPKFISRLKQLRKFSELLNILWVVLDMILSFQPQTDGHTWSTTASVVEYIMNFLSDIQGDDPIITTTTIKISLELIWSSEQFHLQAASYRQSIDRHISTPFQLLKKLAVLPDDKLNEDIKVFLAVLVHLKRPATRDKRTFLHMACERFRTNLATIELLLKSGADLNASDSLKNISLNNNV